MKKLITSSTLLFILILSSCQDRSLNSYYFNNEELLSKIDSEVNKIDNSIALKKYLINILEMDQRYRRESDSIMETFGHDSEEHKTSVEKMHITDAENYFRVSALLQKFGYPSIDSVGEEAAQAPWLAIHHSPIYEHRVKWFPVTYNAYQDGNLNENRFLLYLERMHHWKFKEPFQMKSPYIMEDKIDTLITLLELEEIIEK